MRCSGEAKSKLLPWGRKFKPGIVAATAVMLKRKNRYFRSAPIQKTSELHFPLSADGAAWNEINLRP
jgi:hypothetical protein